MYSCHNINMKFLVVVTPPYIYHIWPWLYPHITLYIKTIYIYGIFGAKFKQIKDRSVEYNEVNHICTHGLWSWWENILYIFSKTTSLQPSTDQSLAGIICQWVGRYSKHVLYMDSMSISPYSLSSVSLWYDILEPRPHTPWTLVDIIVRVTSINGDLHGIFYELIFQATLPLLEYGENI